MAEEKAPATEIEIDLRYELTLFKARSLGAAEDNMPQPSVSVKLKIAYAHLNRQRRRRLQTQVKRITRTAKRLRKKLHDSKNNGYNKAR